MIFKNRIAQNLKLFGAVLLGLLLLSEFLLRSYGVELRMFASDMGRKNKISSKRGEFSAAAQNAGVSEQTFNIYYLGESTMWGVPYGPPAAIPNIVEHHLDGSLGGKPLRSVNFGVAAKDAAYIRYAAELLLREKEVFHPSLIVIYSGHNEFLKFHPTEPDMSSPVIKWLVRHSELARQLITLIARDRGGEIFEVGLRNFMDTSIFPHDRRGYGKAIEHYQAQFLKMVTLAEENKVPLVISTVVSNYAGWEPNRSVLCSSAGTQARKERFTQAFERGLEAENRKENDSSLKAYEEALSLCDHFAEVHFRLGKVYQAQHKHEKAWEAFQKAIDHDGMPIRAVSAQNEFIRSLEHFDHVRVADSLAHLKSRAQNGLLDEHLIIDGVHPNLEGYLLIGEAVAKAIHSLFPSEQERLRTLELDAAKNAFGVGESKMFEVFYETGRWIARLSTWRYDPTRRLKAAETFFRRAVETDPNRYEGFLGLAVVSLIKGNAQDAEGFLQKARSLDMKRVDDYLQIPWIRKIVRRANFNSSAASSLV
jgi:tetratricopeptide (TPR) repeat protein